METKEVDSTIQETQIEQTAPEMGSTANETANATSAGDAPSGECSKDADTNAPHSESRTPTSETAPSVESLEDGLVQLGITPSPSPPPAHSSTGFPRSDYVPPLPGTGMDATNVFIKYLPTDLTNTGLFTLFSQFGEITSCKVMVDPVTGYSLGYGYVDFLP